MESSESNNLPRCSGVIKSDRTKHQCQQRVKYAVGGLCEDCYANVAAKYHGRDQLIKTLQNN